MDIKDYSESDRVQAHLAAIVESSDDAIISKTLEGIITSWNNAAVRMFGYTAEEAIGQHISLIIPKEREDEEFVIIGKVKAGQRLEHFETMRQRKDGQQIHISLTVSPIRDSAGRIIGVSKIARDIRGAREAERIAAYLAAIVDSSDDAIISKNLDGTITSWNPSAERMFGYTAEEAVGKHISLIIPVERIDEEYTILARVKAGERIDHFETVRRTRSGDAVDISLTVSPIRNGAGEVIGASKIARNITEQRRTETLLREASRRKDEFLANMSHELRTPMNAVIGLTHILSLAQSLSPREQQCIAMLRQSGENMMGLINNLLDFSRLETDAVELESVEFNPADIVEKTIIVMQVKAQEKGLPLKVTYDRGLKDRYVGDPLRLQQVLTNLVANAVKFTEKGQVELTVRVCDEDAETSRLAFEVSDTGIGIPEDKLGVIFDKFMQADASTTRQYGGSGLGLSICRAIVNAMGGQMSVVSRPGVGSTFTAEVVLKNADNQTLLTTAGTEQRSHRNVLVVEDYEPNTMVVTSMLEHLGYDYDVAQNGMEALRKTERGDYDIILMDLQMPGMDGFESTRLIRAREQAQGLAPTPIVAMTAHVQPRDKHLCLETGMDDFIPKPFNPIVLTDILAKHINNEPVPES